MRHFGVQVYIASIRFLVYMAALISPHDPSDVGYALAQIQEDSSLQYKVYEPFIVHLKEIVK